MSGAGVPPYVQIRRVTRLRRVGVWYLDLLVGSAMARVVGVFLDVDKYHWPLAFGFWVVLEMLVQRPLGMSFGRYAMGITETSEGEQLNAPLADRQHWFILLLGFLLVLDASKVAVRSLTDYSFFYILDRRFTGIEGRMLYFLAGALLVWAAGAIFRLKPFAPILTVGLMAAVLANDALSPSALRDHALEYKRAREAARGRPSALTPEALADIRIYGNAVLLIVAAGVMFKLRRRFREDNGA